MTHHSGEFPTVRRGRHWAGDPSHFEVGPEYGHRCIGEVCACQGSRASLRPMMAADTIIIPAVVDGELEEV